MGCDSRGEKFPVVYHLHSRFTIWVKGKQNSRLVNFAPESRLPFSQIKIGFKKLNTNFRLEHSDRKNVTVSPFQEFLCSRIFSTGTTWKAVFRLLSNRISFWKPCFCKWQTTSISLADSRTFLIRCESRHNYKPHILFTRNSGISNYILLLLIIENFFSYLILFSGHCVIESFYPVKRWKRRLEPVPCTILLLVVLLSSV